MVTRKMFSFFLISFCVYLFVSVCICWGGRAGGGRGKTEPQRGVEVWSNTRYARRVGYRRAV